MKSIFKFIGLLMATALTPIVCLLALAMSVVIALLFAASPEIAESVRANLRAKLRAKLNCPEETSRQ